MKSTSPLQRGMACLCCRKRKMKCDGLRPVCTQCLKSNRGSECQYYEKKHVSRTQLLQQKVEKLEARLRELEAEQIADTSKSASVADLPSLTDLDYSDLPIEGSPTLSWDQDFQSIQLDASTSYGGPLTELLSDEIIWPTGPVASTSTLPPSLTTPPLSDDWCANLALPSTSTSSTSWWADSKTFCKNKQRLLEIFFAHRHQCAFDVHLGRFQASLQLGTSHRPHPSLMDAIYLLACYFSRLPHLTELEPHFLKRALSGISDALHQQDKIIQVLQASSLIAFYFFCHGRVLEGYYHSSTSARLAIDLGLHQLRPGDPNSFQLARAGSPQDSVFPLEPSFPLSPSVDAIEHAERIAAFWQIFILDRAWSVATGLPSALPDDDHPRTQIETSWPMSIADMSVSPETSGSLVSPFGDKTIPILLSTSSITLRAKAVMLFERSARFATSSIRGGEWLEQRSLEMSLAQFAANLPGIIRHTVQYAPPQVDVDLVTCHTLIFAATIHLNREHVETQRVALEKCIVSANSVVTIVRELTESEYSFLDPINTTCWRSVADVYVRILVAAQARTISCDVLAITEQLNTMLTAIRRLSAYFSVAGMYASDIEQQRMALTKPAANLLESMTSRLAAVT